MKTIDYLNALAKRYTRPNRQGLMAPASDFYISKLLGKSGGHVSMYRNRGVTFDDNTCLKVAELLDMDPAVVMADMHAERAKSEKVRRVWKRIAKLANASASLVIILITLFLTSHSVSKTYKFEGPQLYIMLNSKDCASCCIS